MRGKAPSASGAEASTDTPAPAAVASPCAVDAAGPPRAASSTVGGAALDGGFAHLGRFAVAYRAWFGESPSDTPRRALTGR